MMSIFRVALCGLAALSFCSIAAANNEDGFIWIDANTRIKVKPVSTTAGTGASAPEKSSDKSPKKIEKKEKPAK
jgi:hypothetical protein